MPALQSECLWWRQGPMSMWSHISFSLAYSLPWAPWAWWCGWWQRLVAMKLSKKDWDFSLVLLSSQELAWALRWSCALLLPQHPPRCARCQSYLFLWGILMSAMSLMFLSSLGNLFFGSIWLFQTNLCTGLLVMWRLALFDTQLIIEKGENGDKDYIWHCIDLFLDFVMIFRKLTLILALNEKDKTKEKKWIGCWPPQLDSSPTLISLHTLQVSCSMIKKSTRKKKSDGFERPTRHPVRKDKWAVKVRTEPEKQTKTASGNIHLISCRAFGMAYDICKGCVTLVRGVVGYQIFS